MSDMRGSRNFHERGSNENGNFWSQTRGGPTPKKIPKLPFLGKIFKFQGGGGPDPRSPLWISACLIVFTSSFLQYTFFLMRKFVSS